MSSRTIILIAHGSRRAEANEEVRQLADRLAVVENTSDQFLVAFLDKIAQPNIPETIDQAIAQGSENVLLIPYFLNTGNHVNRDIPAIVDAKRQEYPDVTIEMTAHFGSHPGVVGLLGEIIKKA